MSRPSKYNPETSSRFLSLVEEGYPIKIACEKVEITYMTLSRWKKQHPEFAEELHRAMDRQWINIDNLHGAGVRVYRRNTGERLCQDKTALRSGLKALQSDSCAEDNPKLYQGLKIRSGSISEEEPFTPCINPDTGMVEYFKRQGGVNVKHVCRIDAFRRSNPGWYRKLTINNMHL